jgi:hypothetical protein
MLVPMLKICPFVKQIKLKAPEYNTKLLECIRNTEKSNETDVKIIFQFNPFRLVEFVEKAEKIPPTAVII